MKTYTVAEALDKLRNYCAYQERCHKDVKDKLRTMGMIAQANDQIIGTLVSENYLNETRFAQQFASGKFSIKHWGKVRIKRELNIRGVSDYDINNAIKTIDPGAYLDKIHAISHKKWQQLDRYSAQIKKQKLFQYLAYRGWETDLIYQQINRLSRGN
jgi:regulatory protein